MKSVVPSLTLSISSSFPHSLSISSQPGSKAPAGCATLPPHDQSCHRPPDQMNQPAANVRPTQPSHKPLNGVLIQIAPKSWLIRFTTIYLEKNECLFVLAPPTQQPTSPKITESKYHTFEAISKLICAFYIQGKKSLAVTEC